MQTTQFYRGYMVEYTNGDNFCDSYVVIPGSSLINNGVLGFFYLLSLIYCFLGIAIVADIFMGSIEVITSKTKKMPMKDDNGEVIEVEVLVWNPTIANLTLMALGSSAPEILLSVIETLQTLGTTPGELGPNSIVGSAAFNLMVISGVSILAIKGETKKINDMGVFLVTAVWSVFAYFWMYVVLQLWSPGEIEIAEAVLTFAFFIILCLMAYCADRYNESKQKKLEKEKDKQAIRQLQSIMKDKGYSHIINAIVKPGGGPEHQKIQDLTRLVVGKELDQVNPQELHHVLEPEKVVERLAFRKQFGNMLAGRKDFLVVKGAKAEKAEDLATDKFTKKQLNPTIGFKCLHYSVSEANGTVKIHISKKVAEEVKVGVRTIDDTAKGGEDYGAFDKVITISKDKKEDTIEIEIIDDDQWEPDEDFLVELYDPESKERLPGEDTQCRVTIIDDDEPGILAFDNPTIKVRPKDKFAVLKVMRSNGSDGVVKCHFETKELGAKAYDDFCP